MMGGKKKSKAASNTEVTYEVVDVPDEQVPMASATVPMATAAMSY